MKQFQTIEKLDTGIFSWLFSRPLSSTLDRYIVELIADAQVFQQAGASVRQARQGSLACVARAKRYWCLTEESHCSF